MSWLTIFLLNDIFHNHNHLYFSCVEKGYATFHCTVSLPLEEHEGGPVNAEATVKGGKKKEAVVQCALEACR